MLYLTWKVSNDVQWCMMHSDWRFNWREACYEWSRVSCRDANPANLFLSIQTEFSGNLVCLSWNIRPLVLTTTTQGLIVRLTLMVISLSLSIDCWKYEHDGVIREMWSWSGSWSEWPQGADRSLYMAVISSHVGWQRWTRMNKEPITLLWIDSRRCWGLSQLSKL